MAIDNSEAKRVMELLGKGTACNDFGILGVVEERLHGGWGILLYVGDSYVDMDKEKTMELIEKLEKAIAELQLGLGVKREN